MEQASFPHASLSKTSIEDCSLPGADFMHAKLKGMDFTKAMISGAYFSLSNLKGVTFTPEQAVMLIKTIGVIIKE